MSDKLPQWPATEMMTPKEQLTAYQRWELASFDAIPEAPRATVNVTPVPSNTDELQHIRQKAHDEGHTEGYQAGYAAGIQLGQEEVNGIATLLQNLQLSLTQIDEELAQSLLDLSLEIARKMVIEALQVDRSIILKVVSAAIGNLPHFNHNAHLVLNPDDAALVQKQMGEQLAHAQWKIFVDGKIESGGCRVETAHSHIDATNAARWQAIVDSIGQDKSWLIT